MNKKRKCSKYNVLEQYICLETKENQLDDGGKKERRNEAEKSVEARRTNRGCMKILTNLLFFLNRWKKKERR